jgi:polysaccharide biosynthesis transport protein
MSEHLVPRGSGYPEAPLQSWQEPAPQPMPTVSPLERPVAALLRYKWLMLAVVVAAIGLGVVAIRFVTPQYEVRASIMIASESPLENRSGPIRSSGLLASDDWTQLLKSFTIADAVVRELRLYLRPVNRAVDGDLFQGFALADKLVPGQYELVIDQTSKRWTLLTKPSGVTVDQGAALDSVGRKLGFAWTLPAWVFNSTGTRKVRFTVSTPREVAVQLIGRLGTQRRPESNFLQLTLQDSDPRLAAHIVNTWAREFVTVAADLKKRKLTEFANTLDGQLQTAKRSLDSAEIGLSSFRVNTITQPSEGGPIAAGVQETRDPVIRSYFDKKIEYDDIKHDISQLERLLATRDSIPSEALLQIRSVASSAPAGQALRTAMTEYHTLETNLTAARIAYTDEHPIVRDLLGRSQTMKRERIPQLASALLASLRSRAADDSVRIGGASENLQRIPERTIEEERRRRIRDIASGLYGNLQNRYAEAQLAEASATPDVSVLDTAIAPFAPTKNTAPSVLLLAVIGGVAGAIGLAILLDRLDGRLRYADQVAAELGLPIAGTVPRFPKGGVHRDLTEQTFQLVESFRSLRMSVLHASRGAVAVAVSSPSPSEGKSLIAANLALSFADAGLRTILVDGDTRRGALHSTFGLESTPGLTDYLMGQRTLAEVTQPTSQATLSVIACGTRRRRSPELLTSAKLPRLVDELRNTFDVVIFDTPPLAAGIDGYAISAATGRLLVVLRVGQTTRRMAAAKLRLLDRLPVEVLGAVLNDIPKQGEYAYYSYVPGYGAEDEDAEFEVRKLT